MSSCACRLCRACCKHLPGALTRLADLDRFEAATRRPGEDELQWAERTLVASAGALLRDRSAQRNIEVPTLAMRAVKGGACMYFRRGRCAIYPARPSGCSEFDCAQTDAEAVAIGLPMHLDRAAGWEGSRYARLWEHLQESGHVRSRAALNKRRRKLEKR